MLRVAAFGFILLIVDLANPTAASAENWVDVTGSRKVNLLCVDRESLRRDGSWVYFDGRLCSYAFLPPDKYRIDCSQDFTHEFKSQILVEGAWKDEPQKPDTVGSDQARFVCSGVLL